MQPPLKLSLTDKLEDTVGEFRLAPLFKSTLSNTEVDSVEFNQDKKRPSSPDALTAKTDLLSDCSAVDTDTTLTTLPAKKAILFELPFGFFAETVDTLSRQLLTTIKADKYIRLVTSAIKTYHAFKKQATYKTLYRQFLLARRIIRWQSKYETVMQLVEMYQSKQTKRLPMFIFKLYQLGGDFIDMCAFWSSVLQQEKALVTRLELLQSNSYFMECLVWLIVSFLRAKSSRKGRFVNVLKTIKYLLDTITSYNNSSFKVVELDARTGGIFNIISSVIGIYLLWLA